ncbi:hypothetical protein CCMA1212_008749 [Trichoderma ghanense]|uniref:Uncharacterized protein n=1 Tax=Trichoderma ghanense TaxID=65468 RepID=A0ABY2GUH8_9HYPO
MLLLREPKYRYKSICVYNAFDLNVDFHPDFDDVDTLRDSDETRPGISPTQLNALWGLEAIARQGQHARASLVWAFAWGICCSVCLPCLILSSVPNFRVLPGPRSAGSSTKHEHTHLLHLP